MQEEEMLKHIQKLEKENGKLHELIDALFDAGKRVGESLDITREMLKTLPETFIAQVTKGRYRVKIKHKRGEFTIEDFSYDLEPAEWLKGLLDKMFKDIYFESTSERDELKENNESIKSEYSDFINIKAEELQTLKEAVNLKDVEEMIENELHYLTNNHKPGDFRWHVKFTAIENILEKIQTLTK